MQDKIHQHKGQEGSMEVNHMLQFTSINLTPWDTDTALQPLMTKNVSMAQLNSSYDD